MSILMDTWNRIIEENAPLSFEKILQNELNLWKNSDSRAEMLKGAEYYLGQQDILSHDRYAIGKNGQKIKLPNLRNAHHIDNQYAIALDKKVNYSFGQPFTIKCDDEAFVYALKKDYLNNNFKMRLKRVAQKAIEGGVAYLHPYYNARGELKFKVFPGTSILPFYLDEEHEELDAFGYYYTIERYEGQEKHVIERFDVYMLSGIKRYEIKSGNLSFVEEIPHFSKAGVGMNWERVPLIPFKYNEFEIPLLKRVKSLQDGINLLLSVFDNNMHEDSRNTILVIKNYDGQNLDEFRQNLSAYGVIKVRDDGDGKGGVDTLSIEVNAENYKTILQIFKNALIENARSFDAKDERMRGDPNQMNIQSMFMDMDLDANAMEMEFSAAFEHLLWFIDYDMRNRKKPSATKPVEIIFNRDLPINEGEVIANIRNSSGIISHKSQIEQHPWIDDVEAEIKQLAKENTDAFGGNLNEEFGLLEKARN